MRLPSVPAVPVLNTYNRTGEQWPRHRHRRRQRQRDHSHHNRSRKDST